MSVPTLRRAVAAACIVLSFAYAQEPAAPKPTSSPPAAVTPDLVATLRLAGPAVWRAQLGPTNVGSMFASEAGNGMWLQRISPLEHALQTLLHLDDKDYGVARQRLVDYQGALEIGVWFASGSDLPLVTLRLCGDGKTDIAALARDAAALAAAASHTAFATAPGTEVRGVPLPNDGPWLSEPVAADKDVIAAIAAPALLPAAVALTRERAVAPDTRPAVLQPAMQFSFATATALRMFGDKDRDTKLWRAIGAESLDRFSCSISAAGPHVQFELAHTFNDKDRGLFGVLFPERTALPQFAALPFADFAPRFATKFGHLDLPALHEVIVRGLESTGTTRAESEQELEKFFGKKEGGFFAQFTGEYAMFVSTATLLGDGVSAGGIVLRTKPGDGMNEPWRRVRDELGGENENDLGDGYRIVHIGGFISCDVLLGPELFGFAFGDGREVLTKVVPPHKRGDWQKAPAVPERLSQLKRHAGKGWNGFAEGDIGAVLAQSAGAFEWLREIGGADDLLHLVEGDVSAEDRARLVKLLDEHHLIGATSLTSCADGRWCMRILW